MKQIEIGLDVNRAIELARMDFSESEDDILQRLLGTTKPLIPSKSTSDTDGKSWFGKGVELRHGSQLRMQYRGKSIEAEINNGSIKLNGESFQSLSPAAIHAVELLGGPYAARNGWNDWHVLMPDGSWRQLQSLRPQD